MAPPETSADDQVRCPHCAAVFTLNTAVKVSLPRLLRVQQKCQKSNAISYDTAEEVSWKHWTNLVVDETSLNDEPADKEPSHLNLPEVHVIESEPSSEGSFRATATPTSETPAEEGDVDRLGFVIEGEEASKIFSKKELELSAEGASTAPEGTSQSTGSKKAASDSQRKFNLTFDEALLAEEGTSGEASDMFDFDAESGELGPGEFNIEPKEIQADDSMEIPLAETREKKSMSTMPSRDSMAFAVSRIGNDRKRKSQTFLSLSVGIAGLFLIAIGYYFLNFFGGEQFDLLGIYMPGCPHTYEYNQEVAIADPPSDPLSDKYQAEKFQKDLAELQITDFASSEKMKLSLPESFTANRPIPNGEPVEGTANTHSQGSSQSKPERRLVHPDLFIPQINTDLPRDEFHLPEGEVGLLTYPLFNIHELEATLNATHEEFGCTECQSTGYLTSPEGKKIVCDICMGDPANVMTTMGYRYFCQLGQVVTLFKDDSPRAIEAKQQIHELLKKTVATQKEYSEMGQLTLAKLEEPFHLEEGIMLAGLVRIVLPKNGLYGAILDLPDSDKRVTVISDRPFNFVAEDRVVLLGSIITDPAKNIAGFDAEKKPWVVWYGTSINLPETLP